MTSGTFSILASNVVNMHLLAFNKPKALSTETREEDNTLLNRFFFLDKAVVKLNCVVDRPLHSKLGVELQHFDFFSTGACKISPDWALSNRFVCLRTLVLCTLPGKPVATSKKQRLAPTTA